MLTTEPLKAADAEALLRPILAQSPGHLAVAVSGGADSFALLWLLQQHINVQKLLVLTVDHGLRAGAATEAEIVATWCHENGIEHRILNWIGDKPERGLQAAARVARYRLLAKACEDEKVSWLLTAHNADDQAETIFARMARGSGVDGLAGMRLYNQIAAGAGRPVTLVRPLLDIQRNKLRATAVAHELPFCDDPSNDDMEFERVKRRAFLGAIEAQGLLEKSALLRTGARLRQAANLQEVALRASFNTGRGYFHGSGAICFSRMAFDKLLPPEKKRLASRAIEAVSGGAYPPELDESLFEEPSWRKGSAASFSIGGALVRVLSDDVWIMREPSAVLGRADGGIFRLEIAVGPKKIVLWDNRMIVMTPGDVPEGAILAPVGEAKSGPDALRRLTTTMPGLWHDDILIAVPNYAKKMLGPAAAPWKVGTSTLDIKLLTEERFNRRVIRF